MVKSSLFVVMSFWASCWTYNPPGLTLHMRNGEFFVESGRNQEVPVDLDPGSEVAEIQEKFLFPQYTSKNTENGLKTLDQIMKDTKSSKEALNSIPVNMNVAPASIFTAEQQMPFLKQNSLFVQDHPSLVSQQKLSKKEQYRPYSLDYRAQMTHTRADTIRR